MPNYAFPSSRPSATPFLDGLRNLSSGADLAMEADPQAAFSFFLQQLGLPQAYQRALTNRYQDIYANYRANAYDRGTKQGGLGFLDYLASFNPTYELAKMAPEARFEQPSRFIGRSRLVSY